MKIQVEVLGDNITTKITTEEMSGEIFSFKRENIDALANLKIVSQMPMCYILYHDYYDRNINKNEVYIGQTDTGMERIKKHHREKSGWNKGLLILYENPSYDIIFRLESDLIQLSKMSMKFHLTNVKNENRGYVCNCQKEQYDIFLQKLKDVLTAINIDIFERNSDGAFIYNYKYAPRSNLKATLTKNTPPYEIKILAGSYIEKNRIALLETLFEKHGVNSEIREKTVGNAVRIERKEGVEFFCFKEDMSFTAEKGDRMALFGFKNVNGVSMDKFLNEH
ncbi:hypothetical protein ACKGF9_002713 [Providencia rettgeri]